MDALLYSLYGLLILAALILYFLPSILAFGMKKDNKGAIFLLNIFGGWTVIGWIVAIVWAATKNKN